MFIILWVLLVYSCAQTAKALKKAECPPTEFTPSCTCRKNVDKSVTLTCYDLINMWDFVNVLRRLEDFDIHELYYRNLNIQFLPKGFLKYLSITSLRLSESAILGIETEQGEDMFEGAIESLQTFNMHKVQGAKSWRWKAFSSLKNLKTFGVNSCDLTRIPDTFNLFAKSIEVINFSGNRIARLEDNEFDSFQQMNLLDIANNELSEIKRSMFPDPATKLRIMFISGNKIKDLPKGIFSNMPALRNLDLSSNRIKWLSFAAFEPIHLRLQTLNLKGNDIYCCEEQEWTIVPEFQRAVNGKCEAPAFLAGRDLSSLKTTDLRHGLC